MKLRAVAYLVLLNLFCGSMLTSCGGASGAATAASASATVAGSEVFAFVANSQNASLSVINTATNKLTASISLGEVYGSAASYPSSVAVTPDGTRAYVADANQAVWVVDTATNNVISKIIVGPQGTSPYQLAITPNGKTAYVTTDDSVVAIDIASNSIAATICVGKYPYMESPSRPMVSVPMSLTPITTICGSSIPRPIKLSRLFPPPPTPGASQSPRTAAAPM
jgi:YVTN family beta-propeller protein